MNLSVAKDLYEAFKRVVTIEDWLNQLVESVKTAHSKLENHAERLARLEGKYELLEGSLGSRRRRLPE